MKWVLSFATLALTVLILDDEARHVAGEAQHAYGEAATKARDAGKALSEQVEHRPLAAMLVAGGAGFLVAMLAPGRSRRR